MAKDDERDGRETSAESCDEDFIPAMRAKWDEPDHIGNVQRAFRHYFPDYQPPERPAAEDDRAWFRRRRPDSLTSTLVRVKIFAVPN